MTEEEWKQIRRVVDAALDMPTTERPAYLDDVCSNRPELREEVESLLALEVPVKEFIEIPAIVQNPEKESRLSEPERDRIGRYKIVREIGHGGMARVYEALRDDDLKMRVAVKVVKSRFLDSEEIDWRFRHERRILAGLDHPNIAKLFDGGTTEDGLPYFVMEYVEGKRLDEYCDEEKISTEERVDLFRKVCSAVEYAHRKLVVHRDLKPGNILVTVEGEPKLLDFGIAKLLEPTDGTAWETTVPVTVPGVQPMTPGYASPEQFSGEAITVATDIYSLGVVLYELLTGHNPHRISEPTFGEYRRATVEADPTRPSEIVGQSGTVWTPGQTTAKLTPEHVSRTREGTWRELRRCLLGDLDSILLKALRKETEQRYRSVGELSEDLRNFLTGLPVNARRGDFSYRALKLLKRHRWKVASAAILTLFSAALFYRSWEVTRLEERDRAVGTLVAAIAQGSGPGTFEEKLEELTSGETHEVFRNVNNLAVKLSGQGDYKSAELITRTVLDMKIEKLGEEHESVATSWANLAAVLTIQGGYQEAEILYKKALDSRRLLHGRESPEVVRVMNNLTALYQNSNDLERAERISRDIFEIEETILKEDEEVFLVAQNNRAFLLLLQGNYAKAETIYRDLLDEVDRGKIRGREAPLLRNLAVVLRAQGKFEEAEQAARRSYDLAYAAFMNWRIADAENVLGACLMDLGHFDEAGLLLNRSYSALEKKLGPKGRQTREAKERLEDWRQRHGG